MKIFGKNACREALLNTEISINKMQVQDGLRGEEYKKILDLAKARKVKIVYCPASALNAICEEKRHQGLIIEATEFIYSNLDAVLKDLNENNKLPFFVICTEITDPHNLGAIIRTSECAGANAVIISKNRACQVNETVIRTSAGAVFHIPVISVSNIHQTVEKLKEQNIFVYGLDAKGKNINKVNLTGAVAIVVGGEDEGIKPLIAKTCDDLIALPQNGKINSLNASVAAGIAIYEVLRQRN